VNRFLRLAFFLSGCAGLVYEVIWVKKLTLAFGTTTIASALVVSSYMAGLGLGSIFWGRRADRSQQPLKMLGLLEIGIGLSSLIVLFVLQHVAIIYKTIYQTVASSMAMTIMIIALLAFLIMFIPAFLMGGTFPVISRTYIARNQDIGKGISILYALNTLGGVIGAGFTGFIAVRSIGLTATNIYAAIVNIAIGTIMLILALSLSPLPAGGHTQEHDTSAAEPVRQRSQRDEISTGLLPVVLAAALVTGFVGLGLEILWVRVLSVFLANTTYTFTVVLIVYLSGIFAGSILYSRFLSHASGNLILLALLCTAIGFFVIITASVMRGLPAVLFAFSGIMEVPVLRLILPALILALILMFVPTGIMGITFPVLCAAYIKSLKTIGSRLSMVYLVNAIGSIAGPLAAGLVLIPILGVVKSMIALALVILAAGIALQVGTLSGGNEAGKKWIGVQAVMVMASVIIAFASMKNAWILPPSLMHTRTRADRILYYRETLDGTVVASEDRYTGIRACNVNNSAVIGTTYDALKVVKMLGHVPCIINPRAKRALVIGFGVGITTSSLARHPLETIDCVEICPGVRSAAKYFSDYNHGIDSDPRVRFIGGDGRNYLLVTRDVYDIISCDPTHPTLGSGNLYTREYFELCRDHLSTQGVFCQYLPLHKLSPGEFKTAVVTFASVFPHSSVWLAHSHAIMVGTVNELQISFSDLQSFANSGMDDILTDPYLLAVSLILDQNGVARLCRDKPALNTDDRPVLEYFTPSSMKRENWQSNIGLLMSERSDVNSVITSITDQATLKQYLAGQTYFIQGLKFMNQSNQRQMIEDFKKAAAANPQNEEIRKFIENSPRN
jgi:spermidine synthase